MAKTVTLPGGEQIPALGIGTWNMAVARRSRRDEIVAIQTAVDLGMNVVDTAEMYGNGAAEELVAEAVGHRRREVFLVSKVLPQNASRRGTIAACEASLRRLQTDRLDLYLLHWRGRVPLDETHRCVRSRCTGREDPLLGRQQLRRRRHGRARGRARGRHASMQPPATNQVLYNLMRRGIEFDLLPWCQARGIPIMAYSPLEQGTLSTSKAVIAIARTLNATPSQVALAWVLRQPGVMAIPKSGSADRVRENHGALSDHVDPGAAGRYRPVVPPARAEETTGDDLNFGMMRNPMLTPWNLRKNLIGLLLLLVGCRCAGRPGADHHLRADSGSGRQRRRVGADASRAGREDARHGAGDAAGHRHGSRIGRRPQHHRRGEARRAGDRRRVQSRDGGALAPQGAGSRRRRPRHVHRRRHVRSGHLEGHRARALPAAEQPRQAGAEISHAAARHPHREQHVRRDRMGTGRDGNSRRQLHELVHLALQCRSREGRRVRGVSARAI